jgi:hypothetical protein
MLSTIAVFHISHFTFWSASQLAKNLAASQHGTYLSQCVVTYYLLQTDQPDLFNMRVYAKRVKRSR